MPDIGQLNSALPFTATLLPKILTLSRLSSRSAKDVTAENAIMQNITAVSNAFRFIAHILLFVVQPYRTARRIDKFIIICQVFFRQQYVFAVMFRFLFLKQTEFMINKPNFVLFYNNGITVLISSRFSSAEQSINGARGAPKSSPISQSTAFSPCVTPTFISAAIILFTSA